MILVTGDVVLDHNIYAGRRFRSDSKETTGTVHCEELGGAMLTYGLLQALARTDASSSKGKAPATTEIAFGLQQMTTEAVRKWPGAFQSGAVWEPVVDPKDQKKEQFWRLSKSLGYGASTQSAYPALPAPELNGWKPRMLVIDDGGLGFRLKTAAQCWPEFVTSETGMPNLEWILLKMSSLQASSDLWRGLSSTRWKEKLVVIVTGDNLRREDIQLSKGLSWESTVDDLMNEIRSNPTIRRLQSCRHLVVVLRGDAALWLDNPEGPKPGPCRLVFDRARAEGEWEDEHEDANAFGFLSAMTASVAWNLGQTRHGQPLELVPALKAGLSAARFLRTFGHGKVKDNKPGFPFKETAEHLQKPSDKYAAADVLCAQGVCSAGSGSAASSYWTILSQTTNSTAFPGPLFGPARRLALLGPQALENVPCAHFGKLLTLDRREIEALRSMRQLMLSYKLGCPQKHPLSLAVFGAPGSGKSFGLKQIAEGVFGDKNSVLEFNLSQFKGPEDLIGAYHQVRDQALAGNTPVVFWDEFDSKNYFWLQYLLAPMQDGVFQEGQLTHAIGKCIFVFAGGTSRDFAHFGPFVEPQADETEVEKKARHDFIMGKGPDFKSRLAGFFDVLGPNPRQYYDEQGAREGMSPWKDDDADLDYPARRGILLRSLLGLAKEKENAPLLIDRGLLTALLEIPHYRNGARSMEKLVGYLKDRGGLPLRRAHLPPDSLLALYVDDVPQFHRLIRRSYDFLAQAEKLAPLFHQDWRDTLAEDEKDGYYDRPYEELDQEGKDGNIAAAMRIPEILALAGFVLMPGTASEIEEKDVYAFLEKNKETLAEVEHDGWADQRRLEGWTYAQPPRDNIKRTHPLLVPYAELPEKQKNKDRRTILNYPKYAREAGFKIASGRSDGPAGT